MSEHPFETDLIGKTLLLAAKALTPLVILSLLIVAPTFAPRRLVMDSYIVDFVLRGAAAVMLSGLYWSLPDLAWKFNPQRRAWSVRIWLQLAAYERGRLFLPAYCGVSGLLVLLGFMLTFSSMNVFLPEVILARWVLSVLVALQMGVLMAVQYRAFQQKVFQPPAPRQPASLNGRAAPAPAAAPTPLAGSQPVPRTTPRTARGVVIPTRRPPRE